MKFIIIWGKFSAIYGINYCSHLQCTVNPQLFIVNITVIYGTCYNRHLQSTVNQQLFTVFAITVIYGIW